MGPHGQVPKPISADSLHAQHPSSSACPSALACRVGTLLTLCEWGFHATLIWSVCLSQSLSSLLPYWCSQWTFQTSLSTPGTCWYKWSFWTALPQTTQASPCTAAARACPCTRECHHGPCVWPGVCCRPLLLQGCGAGVGRCVGSKRVCIKDREEAGLLCWANQLRALSCYLPCPAALDFPACSVLRFQPVPPPPCLLFSPALQGGQGRPSVPVVHRQHHTVG